MRERGEEKERWIGSAAGEKNSDCLYTRFLLALSVFCLRGSSQVIRKLTRDAEQMRGEAACGEEGGPA